MSPGPEVIKLLPCSTQLSMEFYLLINSKLLISTVIFLLSLAEYEIFSAYEYENANISWHFHIYQQRKFHAQLSWARKKFYNLGTRPSSDLEILLLSETNPKGNNYYDPGSLLQFLLFSMTALEVHTLYYSTRGIIRLSSPVNATQCKWAPS